MFTPKLPVLPHSRGLDPLPKRRGNGIVAGVPVVHGFPAGVPQIPGRGFGQAAHAGSAFRPGDLSRAADVDHTRPGGNAEAGKPGSHCRDCGREGVARADV